MRREKLQKGRYVDKVQRWIQKRRITRIRKNFYGEKTFKYTVTVTDECGNESVYEFEIVKAKKPVNVGLIIAFVVSMMVAVGAATFLIIKKKREGL